VREVVKKKKTNLERDKEGHTNTYTLARWLKGSAWLTVRAYRSLQCALYGNPGVTGLLDLRLHVLLRGVHGQSWLVLLPVKLPKITHPHGLLFLDHCY
jgi:hypothetical protein